MNRPKPPSKRKVLHPDYSHCVRGTYRYIFIFVRQEWKEPTDAQRADYRRRSVIVEANGGCMRQQEWEIAGRRKRLTARDIAAMTRAIRKSNPDLRVVSSWNGVSCYGYSVAAELRVTGR